MRKPLEYDIDVNGCHICTSHKTRHAQGYSMVYRNGKPISLHRVLYAEKYGPIPEGMVIRHKCDNPFCINVDHLEIGTQRDNMHDAISRGRINHPRREGHPRAKLTESNVQYILSSSESDTILAKRFGVSTGAIYLVRKGVNWKK
ncbi:MAG TPA: HNH endonuclease signature motif containing protein [Candidatus Deferrimicrobium sp.]|nr:HNH endonuclease signature motif containing protein [Candidatus Deferrimicrobium sp.]